MKDKCKLLCESTKDKNLLNLYDKVRKKGVGVGFYENRNDFTNLKGQVKIDQDGNKKAIFMSKYKNKYKLTIIDNQFLISSILEKFLSIYDYSEKEN